MQRTKWALGFAMLVFGFLITTQMRTQKLVPTDPVGLRADEIGRELKATQDKLKAADKENSALKTQLDTLANGGTGVITVPKRDPTLEMLAGTIEARGHGVIVTVVEAPDVANKTRVRDEDLWMVTQELLAGGAEGLSINGLRVTGSTGIRNVGNRIMINQTMTSSPYQVSAIGDPAVLETALRLRNGVIDTAARFGIKITVVRSEQILLPSIGSVPEYHHAKIGP